VIRSGAGDNCETGESFHVQDAQAAVVAALVDAGLEEEDAIHVSENAPVFLQKLVDEMGNEAAEGLEIAFGEGGIFKSGFEVQALSRRQQWRAVLESVGVREQHVDRVSHSLSTLPFPDFFKKVCCPAQVTPRGDNTPLVNYDLNCCCKSNCTGA
jgi:hypothetical protein